MCLVSANITLIRMQCDTRMKINRNVVVILFVYKYIVVRGGFVEKLRLFMNNLLYLFELYGGWGFLYTIHVL